MSAIRLHFPSGICVGGEDVHGEVELVFPDAERDKIQEVIVRIRGFVFV